MTLQEEIKKYLEEEPRARERKLHKRAMVNILLMKYIALQEVEKGMLVDFCNDFESATRVWRKVLEDNPGLRGSDYDDKERLEQEKQIELGYEVGGDVRLPI